MLTRKGRAEKNEEGPRNLLSQENLQRILSIFYLLAMDQVRPWQMGPLGTKM